MWDKVAMTIITDYFLVVVIVCMLAGAGLHSIYIYWINRKCPDLKTIAESIKSLADTLAKKEVNENDLLQKLVENLTKKNV